MLTSTDGAHVACLSGPGPVAVSLVVIVSPSTAGRRPARRRRPAIAAVTCCVPLRHRAVRSMPMRSMAVRSGPREAAGRSLPCAEHRATGHSELQPPEGGLSNASRRCGSGWAAPSGKRQTHPPSRPADRPDTFWCCSARCSRSAIDQRSRQADDAIGRPRLGLGGDMCTLRRSDRSPHAGHMLLRAVRPAGSLSDGGRPTAPTPGRHPATGVPELRPAEDPQPARPRQRARFDAWRPCRARTDLVQGQRRRSPTLEDAAASPTRQGRDVGGRVSRPRSMPSAQCDGPGGRLPVPDPPPAPHMQPSQVARFETLQSMCANAWNKVLVNRKSISCQRSRSHRRRRDVLEPMFRHCSTVQRCPGLRRISCMAEPSR